MVCPRIVKLTATSEKGMKRSKQSHCRDRVAPLVGGLGSEDPQRGARDEMALEIEGVVDGRMHAEKALCGARRLEPLHFALASSPENRLQHGISGGHRRPRQTGCDASAT